MLGLTRTKTHRRAIEEQAETFAAREASLHAVLVEKDAILNSTERNKVLTDLETALCLIEAYQRALSIVGASDPNIIKANAFLEQFNRKGNPSATILGAQNQGKVSSFEIANAIREAREEGTAREEFVFDPTRMHEKKYPDEEPRPVTRQEQEEEHWGDEAYGSWGVRIEAVPIDEGENKEPGYTRARIQFVDANPDPADEDLVYPDGSEVEKLPEEE